MTPEGKVKKKVSDILKFYGAYSFMPVQNGMGAAGLDYHCVVRNKTTGVAVPFFIETKAPGKEPTERQGALIYTLRSELGAMVFVISDFIGYMQLEDWLCKQTR